MMYAIVRKSDGKPVDFGYEGLPEALLACPSDCYVKDAALVNMTDDLARNVFLHQPRISEKDGTRSEYAKRRKSLLSKTADIRNIINRTVNF